MITSEAEVELATRAAKAYAGRQGGLFPWRDFLSPAWWGVHRANARGLPERVLATAAVRAIIDALRAERPVVGADRPGRRRGLQQHPIADDHLARYDPTPDWERDEANRGHLLRAWRETWGRRCRWTWRQRVYAYLYCVEGWTQARVAAYFGVTFNAVSQEIGRAHRGAGEC